MHITATTAAEAQPYVRVHGGAGRPHGLIHALGVGWQATGVLFNRSG